MGGPGASSQVASLPLHNLRGNLRETSDLAGLYLPAMVSRPWKVLPLPGKPLEYPRLNRVHELAQLEGPPARSRPAPTSPRTRFH